MRTRLTNLFWIRAQSEHVFEDAISARTRIDSRDRNLGKLRTGEHAAESPRAGMGSVCAPQAPTCRRLRYTPPSARDTAAAGLGFFSIQEKIPTSTPALFAHRGPGKDSCRPALVSQVESRPGLRRGPTMVLMHNAIAHIPHTPFLHCSYPLHKSPTRLGWAGADEPPSISSSSH